MSNKYSNERRLRADRYIPAQLQILSDYFHCAIEDIRLGTITEDTQQATDVVLPNGTTVGLRVRTPEQIKYKGDFVVRDQPNSPYPTEYAKLLNGKPDYLLYCIAKHQPNDQNATQLAFFSLIDCEAIRAAYRSGWRCTVPPTLIEDGDDGFQVFKFNGFLSTPQLVLSSSEPMPGNTDKICNGCRRSAVPTTPAAAATASGSAVASRY